MTFEVEIEAGQDSGLDYRDILSRVAEAVLDHEGCPYEAQVNLLITDAEGIREINNEQRGIDKTTDVLSFPVFEYPSPADFSAVEDEPWCFDPDSGELLLGDIVISIDSVFSQAESFGHTIYREIAFLIAHSVLHLIGYDHMEASQEQVMIEKQKEILGILGINR